MKGMDKTARRIMYGNLKTIFKRPVFESDCLEGGEYSSRWRITDRRGRVLLCIGAVCDRIFENGSDVKIEIL